MLIGACILIALVIYGGFCFYQHIKGIKKP
jgi:hypothetical protein